MMCAGSLGAAAQITYPYNPDEDGNGQIAVGDLQGILSSYGNAFSPSEILVNGETLTTVITQLQSLIDSLAAASSGSGGSVLDMPLGTVLPIATESVPEGWALCDGRELSIEDYEDLYNLIGTTYGAGDSAFWAQVYYPATTFNIPDLRGRTIIGVDDFNSEESGVLQEHSAVLGATGGEEYHLLSESELPEHEHDIQFYRRPNGNIGGYQNPWHEVQSYANSNVGPTWTNNNVIRASGGGGNMPHNNMQPYMALNYMMKVAYSEDVVSELSIRVSELESQIGNQSVWDTIFFSGCEADQDYFMNSTPVDFLVVQGATFEENNSIYGCVENGYSLTLNSCEGCPNGHIITVIPDLPGDLAPFLEIFSPLELHDEWGGVYATEYLWAGNKWFKLSKD